ncbi:hypothetical protein GCM10009640_07970 [Agrococcus citreus]|uniref:UspA domain-containing protein n=2 Tax=Agrococcus citreus TaxID=84643 RepID=A0ABN1YUC5_9MICO
MAMSGERAVPFRRRGPDEPDALIGAGGRSVVGVDGAAASRAALAWAARRTLPQHPLHLLGVEDAVELRGVGAEHGARQLARVLAEAAADLLDAYPGASVTTEIEGGRVADALVGATRPEDLLVIGSDKTGFVRGRTFGVRSLQLAAALRGALAVVPSVDLRLRTGVVVAVDGLGNAADLALRGAQEADDRGCALTIVHAVARGGGSQRSATGEAVVLAARGAAVDAYPHLDVRAVVAQRHPADAILNASRDTALLLLGSSRGETALGVGETIHDVLMNANAPLVILR